MDQFTFLKENLERITVVENSFGPSGRPLSKPGRFLVGEGRLRKQNRRKTQMKDFFLFNDILVYGSIILNGRWHKKQRIIPLEDLQLEDLEDGEGRTNQWLIRTPRKSFIVSAASSEDKRAWMSHILEYRDRLLQGGTCQPTSTYAMTWIPDCASYKCMRCLTKFTATNRRHHCRKCGFLVCKSCSTAREVIPNIHPTKKLRVCSCCRTTDAEEDEEEVSRLRADSTESENSVWDDMGSSSSGEDEEVDLLLSHFPSSWLDF